LDRLQKSPLKMLALSDTTASALDVVGGKIGIISAARILAQAIWRIHTQQSVGWIFRVLRQHGELPPVERTVQFP
jgi:phosphoribosylpyrophosphate synthetase